MIKVVCVGKIKENYLVDGIKEYLKRIEGFQKIEVVEVKEYNLSDISKNINLARSPTSALHSEWD